MSQAENHAPEVVRISVDNQSFKERMGRRIATLALGAGATAYVVAGFPNPFAAVEDFVGGVRDVAGDVWDGAGKILGNGKEAADETVDKLTSREAQPLVVNPIDVVKGTVQGKVAFGFSEREYHIKHADKKWNTWLPSGDEWVILRNATYVVKAYVPGDIQISGTRQNITVSLPEPVRDMDVSLRKQPEIKGHPQLFAEIGQLPGAETNPAQTLRELHAYAKRLASQDAELMFAASCWGIASAEKLLVPTLGLAGLEVLQGTARGIDGNPDNDLKLVVRGSLKANMDPSSPEKFITRADCTNILGNTIPNLQDETFVLPRRTIEELTLAQEDK